jgi:class 3 adenylate cyclase
MGRHDPPRDSEVWTAYRSYLKDPALLRDRRAPANAAGREEGTLEAWLGGPSAQVALVFTDMVRSTEHLYEQETVNYMLHKRIQLLHVRRLLRGIAARLIDASGDSLFLIFRGVPDAFDFGRRFFANPGNPYVKVRIGIHYGRVTADGSGLSGRAVHYAARVCQHGKDAELWVSDAARQVLAQENGDSPSIERQGLSPFSGWIASEECVLKGIPDKQRLWRAA